MVFLKDKVFYADDEILGSYLEDLYFYVGLYYREIKINRWSKSGDENLRSENKLRTLHIPFSIIAWKKIFIWNIKIIILNINNKNKR